MNNTTKKTVAEKLQYRGEVYKFVSAKRNVLIYKIDPGRDYYGYYGSGGLLIVEYFPNKPENDSYYVLHCIATYERGIEPINLAVTHADRMAKPYVKSN